jgi:hypothetical protein
VNSYRAVKTDAGNWTVEWAASGVVLGHVFGTFDDEGMALLGTFEMSRWDLLESLKRLRGGRAARPFPPGLRRGSS